MTTTTTVTVTAGPRQTFTTELPPTTAALAGLIAMLTHTDDTDACTNYAVQAIRTGNVAVGGYTFTLTDQS